MQSILIVDDNTDLIELIAPLLTNIGYSVKTAHDGEEGLSILRQGSWPDLVLLDVSLPDMTGSQFLDHIEDWDKAALSKSHFVFYSAGRRPADTRGHGYLSKMMNLQQFVASVSALFLAGHIPEVFFTN